MSNFQDPTHPWPSTSKIFSPPRPWTYRLQQTMEQQPHQACERTKSKQKQNQVMSFSNWPRALLFDLAHKQCDGIIQWWFSIGRFLANNILMFDSDSAWCLIMAQIQFSLIKKKDWTSRTLAPPYISLICVSPLTLCYKKLIDLLKNYKHFIML